MNIIVCYKVVPDEQTISILPDGTLSMNGVQWKIGQYDEVAIEAGMRLAESSGGRIIALSVGGETLSESYYQKIVLSMGPEELYLVIDKNINNADTHQTALILAKAIEKIGDFDVVICGEGSSDLNAQQVGIQLGQILGITTVNAINNITIQDGKLLVERTLESESEILELSLPAVISVTTDINLPRIPTMKEIMAAGKKPVIQWNLKNIQAEGLSSSIEILNIKAFKKVNRNNIILEGELNENISKFYEYLRKEMC